MTEQNLPSKKERASLDEIQSAVLSFNDVNIISSIFKQLGWSINDELLETISVARQSVNLGAKISAIKHLRTLLQDAAESSGMLARVSRTVAQDGEYTTFSARRMAQSLNPTKQVESKTLEQETNNDKKEQQPESSAVDRGSSSTGTESGSASGDESERVSDASSGGCEDRGTVDSGSSAGEETKVGFGDGNPCIKHRPPTCDNRLFPGVSSEESE